MRGAQTVAVAAPLGGSSPSLRSCADSLGLPEVRWSVETAEEMGCRCAACLAVGRNAGECSAEGGRNYRTVDAGDGCENGSSSFAGADGRAANEDDRENWA